MRLENQDIQDQIEDILIVLEEIRDAIKELKNPNVVNIKEDTK